MTRRALDDYRQATSALSEVAVNEAREKLHGRSNHRHLRRWAVGAVAAVALVVTAVLMRPSPTRGLEVVTESQSREIAVAHEGQVVVAANSSVVVSDADGRGADVALERGSVSLSVHQAPGARYVVHHRAYSVEAVGTKFSVAASSKGPPRVVVTEGVVVLKGPALPVEGVRLVPEAPREATPIDSPKEEFDHDAGRREEPKRGAGSWLPLFRELVANGDSARATALIPASAPGNCSGCTAKDAVDLGDLFAANAEPARADRAYTRSCEIDRGSAACAVAMVRLALQAEADGRLGEAIGWATKSLESNPRGTFATELTLRRMKWRWSTGARALAKDDARRIINEPTVSAAQRAQATAILEAQ